MLSPRRSAQLGLFAAAVVLASSMTILFMGREGQPPRLRNAPAAHAPGQPLLPAHEGQVVLGSSLSK